MTQNQIHEQILNTIGENKIGVNVITISQNIIGNDNEYYVIAWDMLKEEYIVWNYNVDSNGFYNGYYTTEYMFAIEEFTKRITQK